MFFKFEDDTTPVPAEGTDMPTEETDTEAGGDSTDMPASGDGAVTEEAA